MKNKAPNLQPIAIKWWIALKKRNLILILIDIAIFACVGAFFMFLFHQDNSQLGNYIFSTGILLACISISRLGFKVYKQIWRYATTLEYLYLILADLVAGITYVIFGRFLLQSNVRLMFWEALSMVAVNSLATLSARFMYKNHCCSLRKSFCITSNNLGNGEKLWLSRKIKQMPLSHFASIENNNDYHHTKNPNENATNTAEKHPIAANQINVAIVGAGSIGVLLARKLLLNKSSNYNPYCFIDIDSQKIGSIISGIRVYPEKGIIERLQAMPIQEIIIALPNLSVEAKQRMYKFYKRLNCRVKLFDFEFGRENDTLAKRMLRDFEIEELLFRDVIHLSEFDDAHVFHGKTILITGGGGSIGSELCRQLAFLKPSKLVVFDIYENSAYDIEQELKSKYGNSIQIIVEIGSVRDNERLEEVFEMHHPQIVFHAAAHKHVPLMENCCGEAIKNNVFGTLNTVNMAERFGVERFLLVSTDKAVNPTNVMGASKRLCEMIIQSKKNSNTIFTAVRFGNVLGSNGSVIPLFKKQIASGGPITLTDKRIIRYFMTISEATNLLLQTCAMASTGEIYVLDMGRPVKILDLAENLIRLSGLMPYIDIDIKEIGLRPGEKLYEELLRKPEGLEKTQSNKIFIEKEEALSEDQLSEKLELLRQSLSHHSQQAVIEAMHIAVSSYHTAEEVNRSEAEQSLEMKSCQC